VARAAEVVAEVRVCVDVDDVDLADRLQATTQRVADRVIAADGDRQRAALDDPPDGLGDPVEVALDLEPWIATSPTSAIVTPSR
jgi:hypothetical protein